MKDKILKFLLINLIFLIHPIKLSSNELIIPQKKPIIASDLKKKSILSNYLLPKKKPSTVNELDIKQVEIKKEIVNGILIPKSKPLIVKKDRAIAK